jgi:predicted nucleic acid-binding protein
MRVYLDMCSIQRPLDSMTQRRVRIEAEAILEFLAGVRSGLTELVSSDVLELEASRNPDSERRSFSMGVLAEARLIVRISREVRVQAREFEDAGIKAADALHLACAVAAKADLFCTCDDRFLKRARAVHAPPPKMVDPLALIGELET